MKTVRVLLLILGLLILTGASANRPMHHTDEGFQNYPLTPPAPSLGIGFYLRRAWSSFFLPDVPTDHYLAEAQAIKQLEALKGNNTLTWIGQSTFLIRVEGKAILTDPFFSEYAGPYSMGPKRFIEPGISAENLPLIDIIVISHNHYDHLDEAFIEVLPNKNDIHVFVPLGLKGFFTERGYSQVHELDWYENASVNTLKITALPSVHYSGRGGQIRTKRCGVRGALILLQAVTISLAIVPIHQPSSRRLEKASTPLTWQCFRLELMAIENTVSITTQRQKKLPA